MPYSDTADRILRHADDLFYAQGFETTSFAHIAKAVNISRGNFYHHFRTKDEILDGVIDRRLSDSRDMIEAWEAESDQPAERICAYIRILTDHLDDIMRQGCPVGTLSDELAKLDHAAKGRAVDVFTIFRDWLTVQFQQLGFDDETSDAYAMRVLLHSQGVATLASAYRDADFVRREVNDMSAWVRSLAQKPD